jgi:hypothetical protein
MDDPLRSDPLALDVETRRELGYRTVDRLVEQVGGGRPGLPWIAGEETEARLDGPAPEDPVPPDEVFDGLDPALSLPVRVPGSPSAPACRPA